MLGDNGMANSLFVFFLSLFIVIVFCAIVAIIRQRLSNKKNQSCTVSGSDNHIMETSKYSGKYSVCKKIGEADAEF